MNADNVTSNDTQGETLPEMPNSFELKNRVRCFNHTLQLSVKTLLRPFNAGLGKATEDGTCDDVDNLLSQGIDDDDEEDDEEDEEDEEDEDGGLPVIPDEDDIDDGIDELDALDADSCEAIMNDTAAVCETVTKVCILLSTCNVSLIHI
jgi:hypothetical protein